MTEKPYDFSGYVTKNDILCSDGRTIRRDAFLENDGKVVPMVWMHKHDAPENVLGHMVLENRPDGVYGYGYFNDTDRAKTAKMLVEHGDISCMSIWANQLKQRGGDVIHGLINEVSLVLNGANRGALIDSRLAHGDFSEDEAIICMGDDEPVMANEDGYLIHYGVKGMKWGEHIFETEYEGNGKEINENAEALAVSKPSVIQTRNSKNLSSFPDTIRKKAEGYFGEFDKYAEALVQLHPMVSGMKKEEARALYQSSKIQDLIAKFKDVDRKAYDILIPASEKSKATAENKWTEDDYKQDMDYIDDLVEYVFGSDIVNGDETVPNRPRSREVNITGEGKPIVKGESSGTGPVGQNVANRPVSGTTKADSSADPTKNAQQISTSSYDGSGKETNPGTNSGSAERPSVLQTADSWDTSTFPPAIRKKLEKIDQQARDYYRPIIDALERYEDAGSEAERAQIRNSPEFANAVAGYRDTLNQMFDTMIPVSKNGAATGNNKWTENDKLKSISSFDSWIKENFFPEVAASAKTGNKMDRQSSMSAIQEDKNKISRLAHADGSDLTVGDVWETMTEDQKNVVLYLLAQVKKGEDNISHSEEDDYMKNNVFEQGVPAAPQLSAEDVSAMFNEAKRTRSSMKDTVLAHADDYGITNIEYLFPDDRQLTSAPVFIKKPDEWVKNVMGGVSHTPFSRVKTVFADITEADARAKGYVKGNRKMEEVITLLKRRTDPQTVYKKQKIDRDDQIDITDFNVVAWLKTEMRMKLDEELAQAFLIGDLRSPASEDKISEEHIRPIWKDNDLFVIRKAIPLTSTMTPDDRARKFIRMAVKARKDYRGKGNPSLFTTEDLLTDMMLIEDTTGRPLYDSEEKLRTALRVKEIIPVPALENVSRIVGTSTMNLMGIIVNLADYTVGADKGGSVEMFEDFDIDFNQNKYLIETRCSGALTVPYSAIVIEGSESMYLDVDPIDGSETQYGKSVADLQSGIVINEDSIAGTLKYVTGYTGFSGDPEEQKGNFLALQFDAPSGATTTVEVLGGKHEGSPVTLDSDMTVVFQIANKSQKIRVVSTNDGMEIAKTYSLRLLKLNGPNT